MTVTVIPLYAHTAQVIDLAAYRAQRTNLPSASPAGRERRRRKVRGGTATAPTARPGVASREGGAGSSHRANNEHDHARCRDVVVSPQPA